MMYRRRGGWGEGGGGSRRGSGVGGVFWSKGYFSGVPENPRRHIFCTKVTHIYILILIFTKGEFAAGWGGGGGGCCGVYEAVNQARIKYM